MKNLKITALVILCLVMTVMSASSVFAAAYTYGFEDNKAHVGSLLGCSDSPALEGNALWCVTHSASLNNDPVIDYHCSRRINLFPFEGGNIPAGDYTVTVWVADPYDIYNTRACYTSIFLTMHEAGIDDEILFYSHDDANMTPVKLTVYSQDGEDFAPTGNTQVVGDNTWMEYTARIKTDKELGLGDVWLYSDNADEYFTFHMDSLSIEPYVEPAAEEIVEEPAAEEVVEEPAAVEVVETAVETQTETVAPQTGDITLALVCAAFASSAAAALTKKKISRK